MSSPKSSRREFLEGMGSIASLSLLDKDFYQMDRLQVVEDQDRYGNYQYRGWEDLYREKWGWDSKARSTHGVNCTGSCSWKVFVKNGQVWREEQAGDYPQISSDLPDLNPRGCQKGACYSDYVHADQRVKYPLKRVGKRGEGKWKRITWDRALNEISREVIDKLKEEKYDTISGFTPIPAMSPVSFASGSRLINLLGGVSHSFYDWYSDLPPGEPLTWGFQTDSSESADWYNADYMITWGSDPLYSRIPDAKQLVESRYDGTKVVGIYPDYAATATRCDEWLSPEPGSDAALALGMVKVIIDEGLYDTEHIKEQTDMPLLVRNDNGKFLRSSEINEDGNEKTMVMLDSQGRLREAPGSLGRRDGERDSNSSIVLNFDPKIDVETEVETLSGQIRVKSVWTLLKEELSKYTPEFVHQETTVGKETYQKIAREFANVDRAKIMHGRGINGWYHNDLMNRSLQLLVTITGNIGRQGTGFDHYVGQEKIWTVNGWKKLSFPTGDVRGMPTTLWTYYHSGILDYTEDKIADKIKEAVRKDWMPLYPEERPDGSRPDPSIMFIWRGNYLNQANSNVFVENNLLDKLDLMVDINFRMDSTALYSDYVLPAASHYEKYDISVTDLHSFIHPFTPAIEPLAEAKSDWEIFRLFAKKIQEIAREENIKSIQDRKFDREIDLQNIHTDYIKDWETGDEGRLKDDKEACRFILENSEQTNPPDSNERITFEDIEEKPRRFLNSGHHWTSPIEDGKAYTPWKDFVQQKNPWPTFTGRQQYYIDHDWFLDMDEELPTYKKPKEEQDGDKYPLKWITPHPRWSIHSTWRDHSDMLELQRGEPIVWISPEDAEERNIEDEDTVEIYNNLGSIEAKAKLYPSAKKGSVLMYHAWEKYQFPDGKHYNWMTPMMLNPTQLVRYPEDTGEHLHFFPNYWGPTGVDRDTKVEIEKKMGDR